MAFEGIGTLAAAVEGSDLGRRIQAAVDLIHASTGRVIVTGVGKSGHIGKKLAATLSSTGTPSYFMHPTEAVHGDLGVIGDQDVLFAISWSGETQELAPVVAYAKRFGMPVIAMSSQEMSTLAQAATVSIALPKVEEACPLRLAPTTSALLQLATGDAIAIALLERRGFSASDFHNVHPGGKLGAQLRRVHELMHDRTDSPIVPRGTLIADAILVMTANSYGVVGVVDAEGGLEGVITDGDLRRHMNDHLLGQKVEDVMSLGPKVIGRDAFAAEALQVMNAAKITVLFVVDDKAPEGIVRMHDLLRAGLA